MTTEDAKKWFKVYYGQNLEDLILRAFFPDVKSGFYIDVGAHDPEVFSVTKLFYDSGWTGINIEPQKKYHKMLAKARPRDANLNIALGNSKGEMTLREYPEASGLSTISEAIKSNYKNDKVYKKVTDKYVEYPVQVDTLSSIFKEYAGEKTVHFLKIDVEGFEREVILGNNWKVHRPILVCIEANHIVNDWHSDIISSGYKLAFFDGLNEYYIAEEFHDKLINDFDYVKTVLSQIPVQDIPFEMFTKEIDKFDREVKTLNEIIKKQEAALKDLSDRYNRIINSKGFKAARYVKNKTKKIVSAPKQVKKS